MKRWLSAVLPSRIGGQILLLVVAAVFLTQALNFGVLFVFDQGHRAESRLRSGLGTFLSGVRMLAASPMGDWPAIAEIVRRTEPDMNFAYQAHGSWGASAGSPGEAVLGFVRHELGPSYEVVESPAADDDSGFDFRQVSVRMPDGTVVSGRLLLPPPPPPGRPSPAWNILVFALVFLPLIYFWAAWGLSRQLRSFARAAEGFSVDGRNELLPENGPAEIAQVARALNRMRDRILDLLGDRTRMLSAIGHDLRTPITRLRLRAEFIEEPHMRTEILRDLDRMRRMIDAALAYIRDGRNNEQPIALDLPALLRTVADNFADLGENVSCEGEERLSVMVQPDAMVRAVENLVENATRFGSRVVVRSARSPDQGVVIEVEDDGVGIPEDERRTMLQPFVRGDTARTGNAAGFGLGLSITEGIVQAHGGTFSLLSGELGGLLARIELPAHIVLGKERVD